jgi:hypothetical protein
MAEIAAEVAETVVAAAGMVTTAAQVVATTVVAVIIAGRAVVMTAEDMAEVAEATMMEGGDASEDEAAMTCRPGPNGARPLPRMPARPSLKAGPWR